MNRLSSLICGIWHLTRLIQMLFHAAPEKLASWQCKKLSALIYRKTTYYSCHGSELWTINPWHVKVFLQNGGLVVPELSIFLPTEPIEGPDEGKEDKVFIVNIKINKKEVKPTKCVIHYMDKHLKEEWFASHLKPILESDHEVLDTLPIIPRTIDEEGLIEIIN